MHPLAAHPRSREQDPRLECERCACAGRLVQALGGASEGARLRARLLLVVRLLAPRRESHRRDAAEAARHLARPRGRTSAVGAEQVLQGVPLKPIVPRQTLGRWRQTYYLTGRSFRQHDMGTLSFTCLILFVQAQAPLARPPATHLPAPRATPLARRGVTSGLAAFGVPQAGVFSSMARTGDGYSYAFLAKYLTGYNAATPLFYLFIASFTRPLFTKERLNYNREFKSGISSIGYFFARNLYNFCMLPFLAGAFSISCYIFAPPVQASTPTPLAPHRVLPLVRSRVAALPHAFARPAKG